MLGLGVPELVVVLVVVVVAFGPKRLPQVGQALGSSIQSFRKASREAADPVALPSAESPSSDAGGSPNNR